MPRLGFWAQTGLLAGPFMSMIDSSVINVALPAMARSLHASIAGVQWVASAYLLALGLGTPAAAYVAKRWGTERVYALSLLGFTAASGLCALAPTVPVLVTIRILQGAFGALLVPLAMHMLLGGDRARSRMSSAAGMVLFLAPAIGPALGGLLIQTFGWPAIFLINVPVGAVAMWGTRHIPPDLAAATGGAGRFDGVGFGLLAAGVVGLSCGAALGPSQGWLASGVWPYWAAGTMLLLGYARWASHTSRPVLDLHLLHDFQASLKLFLTAIVSVVMFAMVFLVPVYLQDVQGRTATAAGLTLLPQGLVTGVGTFIGLTLPQRWGLRRTVLAGLVLLTAGTVGLLAVTQAISPVVVAAILCGRGFAIGLVVQPLITTLIGGLPEDQVPDATTLFNVVERVSGTLGIALIVTLFQARERVRTLAALDRIGHPPGSRGAVRAGRPLSIPVPHQLTHAATLGFHDVIWWVAGASAMSVGLALGLKDPVTGSDT